ncbi:uncharacterized protein BKCO1_2900020 [Diplodia corticola]|uniref:DUF6594 domain-containing protein n=1 Tax=Diplodia corticola TaxID=236234 RepID=A0A1J9QZV9_9PEZI|nr:uncharacterized protein BKCO1_2900020 [Diplodia corticola]OJD33530.1 hypothetical protein BKCO1_2900020 [Diplodia corticola]
MSSSPTHRPAPAPIPTLPEGNSPSIPMATFSPYAPAAGAHEPAPTTGSSQQSAQPSGDTPPQPPVPGYPLLADHMGRMPQIAIFRRFGAINTLDLLYRQAELKRMEKELREEQEKSANMSGDPGDYAINSYLLEDDDGEQWKVFKKIRIKLKEYNEALALQMTILSADTPSNYDLRWLQHFLWSEAMGGGILGPDRNIWGHHDESVKHEPEPDLVSLLPQRNEDFFSKWMTENVVTWLLHLDKERKPDRRRGVVSYESDKVLRWTFAFSTAIASVLPVLSIAILYTVRSQKVRLALIAVFNVALAFAISLLASPRIVDTFTASFAFSAINVIWFSSSNATDGA